MSTLRCPPLAGCLLIGLAVGIFPAVSLSASEKSNGMLQSHQGVRGFVMRLQGNQMPTVNRKKSRTEPEPLSTQVWIFSGRIQGQGTRWSVSEARKHPNLINRVHSDVQGKFFVGLPLGEYTLFAQYGSDLYLNSFLGDGSYGSVQVSEGKITEIRLVNTEGATF